MPPGADDIWHGTVAGRRIVKDLYAEHAAVAALSDAEVAKLRAVRATVVEGTALKPVLHFNQAGALRLQTDLTDWENRPATSMISTSS